MTDMIKVDEAVLKTDGLGRVKTPPERREQLLDEYDRSGLSGMKFAALTGIKYPTFAAWLSKRRRQRNPATQVSAKPAAALQWLEAVVEEAQNCGGQNHPGLVVQLPGGARIQLGDAKQAVLAAALLRALEPPC
jgi:hypothetical protein